MILCQRIRHHPLLLLLGPHILSGWTYWRLMIFITCNQNGHALSLSLSARPAPSREMVHVLAMDKLAHTVTSPNSRLANWNEDLIRNDPTAEAQLDHPLQPATWPKESKHGPRSVGLQNSAHGLRFRELTRSTRERPDRTADDDRPLDDSMLDSDPSPDCAWL